MKATIVRSLVAVAAAGGLVVTGTAVATAGNTGSTAPPSATSATDPATVAKTIESLRHDLASAVESADLSAVTSTTSRLEAAVDSIVKGEVPVHRAAQQHATAAEADVAAVRDALPEARSVPDPAAMLNDLVQNALTTLGALVDSLLGSVPEVPAPGLPDPGLPDPGLPDADLPDADVPDADLPDADVPDADVPEADLP